LLLDGEGDTTEGIVANYDAIILRIEELKSHCYISVKPWPLKHSADLFRHFSQEAKSRGVKMHFDSASTSDQEQTLSLIRDLVPISGTLSYTLPGRWHRSVADTELAIEQGLDVRVVKGQWVDPSEPVDPFEGFLKVIERLAGRARHVSVATHDPKLVRAALSALLRGAHLASWSCCTACRLELCCRLPGNSVCRFACICPTDMHGYRM